VQDDVAVRRRLGDDFFADRAAGAAAAGDRRSGKRRQHQASCQNTPGHDPLPDFGRNPSIRHDRKKAGYFLPIVRCRSRQSGGYRGQGCRC
jgi:hypothetical protein